MFRRKIATFVVGLSLLSLTACEQLYNISMQMDAIDGGSLSAGGGSAGTGSSGGSVAGTGTTSGNGTAGTSSGSSSGSGSSSSSGSGSGSGSGSETEESALSHFLKGGLGSGQYSGGGRKAQYFMNHFSSLFPSGLTIGVSAPGLGHRLFSSAEEVQAYLESTRGEQACALNLAGCDGGSLAGHAIAVMIHVAARPLASGIRVRVRGSCDASGGASCLNGRTVAEVMALIQRAIAGGELPVGVSSLNQLTQLLAKVNNSLDRR